MKNTVRVERAILDITQPSTVLALKIARHFGKPVESIFQLEEKD